MLTGALNGVRVVEWGDFISAPFCGKALAELGADVIKVEPPSLGDSSRRSGPFPDNLPDPERSGLFLLNNINKRSVSLDLETFTGRELFGSLLESADVFLENQPPELPGKLGLDYEGLKWRFPRLIVTSISPYGRTGPYSGFKGGDLTNNALGGLSFGTGHPDREPLTHASPPAQLPCRRGSGRLPPWLPYWRGIRRAGGNWWTCRRRRLGRCCSAVTICRPTYTGVSRVGVPATG